MDDQTQTTETAIAGPGEETSRARRTLLAVWLILLALTAASLSLGEVRAVAGATNATLVLGIALAKGTLIAGIYMELREAPRHWAVAMAAFLVALTATLVGLFIA